MGTIDTRIADAELVAEQCSDEARVSTIAQTHRYPRVISRLNVIADIVQGKDVLDIGCVDARPGGVRKYESSGLHKFLGQYARSLVGVDIDEEGTQEMRSKGHNILCADAESMQLGQKFDCIVAGEIIEHLNNPGNFLATMASHLRNHGALIITTPNAFGISNFFRIMRMGRVKVHPGHTCWYDPITLTQLIHRYDLQVEKIYFANKDKWYRPRYFYKIFRYQFPKLISWLRPYYSSTIVAIVRKR